MPQRAREDSDMLTRILKLTEELNHIQDLDAMLDRVLFEARALTNADAGSIFLVDNDKLKFSYVHNNSLFSSDASNKYIYANYEMDIDDTSIAGHVAATGKPLVLEDVYHLSEDVPFTFNRSFDEASNYRTQSVLTVPLTTSRDNIVGVLQIINAMHDGKVISFTDKDMLYVNHFGNNAAVAIERAMMMREIILRMIRMAELRDPKETGAHVNRVGAYSAEIYQKWASNHGIPVEEIKKQKDLIRIAGMLHDVGKVAISDIILKKPAKLTDEEFAVMKYHTLYGAHLFRNATSELDRLSAEISLNHHEKWNGRGYPGRIDDIFADNVGMGQGKEGEEIPLCGRITALADVFDALCSKRVYKDAWDLDDVLTHIRAEAGSHFDPELVEVFFSIQDVIAAIREKYQEE